MKKIFISLAQNPRREYKQTKPPFVGPLCHFAVGPYGSLVFQ